MDVPASFEDERGRFLSRHELDRRHEEALRALDVKEQMLWTLLQEKEAAEKQRRQTLKEIEEFSRSSTRELNEWVRYERSEDWGEERIE